MTPDEYSSWEQSQHVAAAAMKPDSPERTKAMAAIAEAHVARVAKANDSLVVLAKGQRPAQMSTADYAAWRRQRDALRNR